MRVTDPFVKRGAMRADARKNYDQILGVAADLLSASGGDASLRDIARTAGVGLGTMHRHFPTREVLLEALLRASFDDLGAKAMVLERADASDTALAEWLREVVAVARNYGGAIKAMVAAIEDERSALHASCVAMKAAGARLLTRAQADGRARRDMDGADLFAIVGAISWIGEQPAIAVRTDRILTIILDGVATNP